MQGRAGESSPALLCLGIALERFNVGQQVARVLAQLERRKAASSTGAPKPHFGNRPAFAKLGGRDENSVGGRGGL
jgi:hypothetical protein